MGGVAAWPLWPLLAESLLGSLYSVVEVVEVEHMSEITTRLFPGQVSSMATMVQWAQSAAPSGQPCDSAVWSGWLVVMVHHEWTVNTGVMDTCHGISWMPGMMTSCDHGTRVIRRAVGAVGGHWGGGGGGICGV